MLDTRSTYQRIRDWICALFYSKRKKTKVEVTRVLSSYERENRLRLRKNHYPAEHSPILTPPTSPSSSQSIGPKCDSKPETERTFRKIRVYPAPLVRVAGRNSSIRCRSYLSDIARSTRDCPVCHEPLVWTGTESLQD